MTRPGEELLRSGNNDGGGTLRDTGGHYQKKKTQGHNSRQKEIKRKRKGKRQGEGGADCVSASRVHSSQEGKTGTDESRVGKNVRYRGDEKVS